MNIVEKNHLAEKGSFLYVLCKENLFNEKLFLELQDEIVNFIKNNQSKENHLQKMFFIYSNFAGVIISHHNKKDLYEIMNYNDDMLVFLERFEFLYHRCLDRDIVRLINFEDEKGEMN